MCGSRGSWRSRAVCAVRRRSCAAVEPGTGGAAESVHVLVCGMLWHACCQAACKAPLDSPACSVGAHGRLRASCMSAHAPCPPASQASQAAADTTCLWGCWPAVLCAAARRAAGQANAGGLRSCGLSQRQPCMHLLVQSCTGDHQPSQSRAADTGAWLLTVAVGTAASHQCQPSAAVQAA
jgi:hypothetical protein